MENVLLYLLIVIAIGSGWWLGRRERVKSTDAAGARYYQGLNYLLNEEPDRAVSSFIRDLEVNADTLETHLALGGLLRKRGELEKALVIHENILRRAQLDRETSQRVQLELARDYLLAGLLDRAEELAVKLADASPAVRRESLKIALEVYETEKEWRQAIEVAERLAIGDETEPYERAISHYYCEIAEENLAIGQYEAAHEAVTEAIGHASNNARASLILGRIDFDQGRYDDAIRVLQRIRQQEPVYVAESLPVLLAAYTRSQAPDQELRDYLMTCLKVTPSISIVLAIAANIREELGDDAMARFVAAHLKENPTLRGLTQLIDLHIDNTAGAARENLTILRSFTEALVADKPAYRCHGCGFEYKKMRWHCPSCKDWASIKPIFGLEGE